MRFISSQISQISKLRQVLCWSVLAGGMLGAVPGAAVQAEPVVAKVGSVSITQSDLMRHLLAFFARVGSEQLAERSILDQEAKRRGITVSDAEIAERLATLKKEGGDTLAAALESGAVTEGGLREQVRYRLLAEKVTDAKWPVKNQDLTRISLRYVRTTTQQQAREVISEARRGVDFDLLAARGLDWRETQGRVRPDPFFRLDNPAFFKAAADANLRQGQLTNQPIKTGEYWLVLRLDKILGPETLTPKERETITNRIRTFRLLNLMPSLRKTYRVTAVKSSSDLLALPEIAGDEVVATVGEASVTWQALRTHLLEMFGKAALEQLVDRQVLLTQARKANVTVADAEVNARIDSLKKAAGEKALADVLTAEGITEEAWKERVRLMYTAERVQNALRPITTADLTRMTVRYIRVASRADADEVLRALQGGQPFEEVMAQRSLDKGEGFLRPKIFFREDQPQAFDAIVKVGLKPGQALTQPLQIGNQFLVLKLEGQFGTDTLSARERDAAVRRINTVRASEALARWRKEASIEYPMPLQTLIAGAGS